MGFFFKNIFITICIYSSLIIASDDKALFMQANQLYKNDEIEKALQTYQSIEPKGYATWFNMGVCCYLLGDDINALLYWYKAQRLASYAHYNEITSLIQKIKRENFDIHSGVEFFKQMQEYISMFIRLLPFWLWQILFLLLWCFLFMLFFLSYFEHTSFWIKLIMSLLVIALGLSLWVHIKQMHQKRALVIKNISIYAGTDKHFSVKDELRKGQVVSICDKTDSWYKVRNATNIGWVEQIAISLI